MGHREFRQQVYLAKDKNGMSAFHKAIGNGHKEMAEHLIEKTDRGVVNQVYKKIRNKNEPGVVLLYIIQCNSFNKIC